MCKEFLVCIACGLFALPSAAQKYTISGSVPHGVTTVYLQNLESQTPDSSQVKNGTFVFNGDAEGKLFGIIGTKENLPDARSVQIVLDGNIQVDLKAGVVSGNAENEGMTAWSRKFAEPQHEMNVLMSEVAQYEQNNKAMPDSVTERINKVYDQCMLQMGELVKACCQQNQQYRFPAFFLINMATSMEQSDVIALAENGNPAYMTVPVMEHLKHRISGWKKQMPGTMFTDLSMNDTSGMAHRLSEYVGKGKYVLIDFWASWCAPCRRSMPDLKKVYNKYKDKNFEIVGLSFDQNKTAWVNSITKLELPWIHLSDLKGWESVAAGIYGINSIPATLLIGPDGKIIASGLHAEELDSKLAELLK